MTAPIESKDEPKLRPHSPLRSYYGEDKARHGYVMDLFDKTAHHYDTIERVFLNGGLHYRRFSLSLAGLRKGMKVLDVAIGTAAVAKGAIKIVGSEGQVYGVDPNRGMLGQAKKAVDIPLTRGVAQELPFANDSFDFVTMGIALRHVSDLVAAFGEYHRVLKPGGRLWILEGHVPSSKLGLSLARFFWAKVIPGMTLLTTRDRDAKLLMDYYWDTVEFSADSDKIVGALAEVGFDQPRYKLVVPGAFCEYSGVKAIGN